MGGVSLDRQVKGLTPSSYAGNLQRDASGHSGESSFRVKSVARCYSPPAQVQPGPPGLRCTGPGGLSDPWPNVSARSPGPADCPRCPHQRGRSAFYAACYRLWCPGRRRATFEYPRLLTATYRLPEPVIPAAGDEAQALALVKLPAPRSHDVTKEHRLSIVVRSWPPICWVQVVTPAHRPLLVARSGRPDLPAALDLPGLS
jgi:hypothetical protein